MKTNRIQSTVVFVAMTICLLSACFVLANIKRSTSNKILTVKKAASENSPIRDGLMHQRTPEERVLHDAYNKRLSEVTGEALVVEDQGDAAVLAKDFFGAEAFYKRAIEMSPKFDGSNTVLSGAPHKLSLLYIDTGRWQDAIEAEIGQLPHGDPGVINPMLCIAYCELGDEVSASRVAPRNPGANGGAFDHIDKKTGNYDQTRNLPPAPSNMNEWKAGSYFVLATGMTFSVPLDERRMLNYFQNAAEAYPEVPTYSYRYMMSLSNSSYLDSALEWAIKCQQHAHGHLQTLLKGQRYDLENLILMKVPYNKGRKPD